VTIPVAALGPIPADPTDPAWHEARRTFIGASDAPAVLGLSPWSSALDVWAEKLGLVEPFQGNEDLIARKWAALNPEATVINLRLTERHQKYPHIAASVDRVLSDVYGHQLLECKYVGPGTAHQWENGPPDHVQVQCQVQMAVTGAIRVHVCALIIDRTPEWKTWAVQRDEPVIADIIGRLNVWWQNHIVEGFAPNPDDTDPYRAKDTLGRIYDRADGVPVRLSGASLGLIEEIKRSKALRKDLDAQITAAENELRAALGDATEGFGDDNAKPVVTWRAQDRFSYDTKAVMAGKVEGFTADELDAAGRVLWAVEKVTTSRVLRIS